MTKSSGDFPYSFLLTKIARHWQVTEWCTEQFGERWSVVTNPHGVWCCFWLGFRSPTPGHYKWSFKNEQDALWFISKWGR